MNRNDKQRQHQHHTLLQPSGHVAKDGFVEMPVDPHGRGELAGRIIEPSAARAPRAGDHAASRSVEPWTVRRAGCSRQVFYGASWLTYCSAGVVKHLVHSSVTGTLASTFSPHDSRTPSHPYAIMEVSRSVGLATR